MKRLVVLVALTLFGTISAFAQRTKLATDLVGRNDRTMVEVIIRYKVAPSNRHWNRVATHGGTVRSDFSFIKALHVSVPAARLAALAADKDVEFISPNRPLGSKLYNRSE